MPYRTRRVQAGSKMDAVDGHVRFQQEIALARQRHNRGIIADAKPQAAGLAPSLGAQPANEFRLSSEHHSILAQR